jgi:DNA replication licensing factor MCM5
MRSNQEWVLYNSYKVEGLSRGKFAEEVQTVEDVIRKRFPLGSHMSERRLKDELLKQDFSADSVNKAIFKLLQKEVLMYEERRTKIRRVRT